MEKILQWHYQQGWTTGEIEEELKKPKYKLELALIHRWRASQGVYNPKMWDFPQDFDKDIQDMSSEIQKEMTENVKKQKNTLVKSMKESALNLNFLKERAVPSAFLANFGRPAKSVCVSAMFSRHCK